MDRVGSDLQEPETDQERIGIWAGIDWGTHSSKWAYFREASLKRPVVGPIRNSKLVRVGDQITFSPSEDPVKARPIHSIKKLIIADPAGAFWDGIRSDTQTTIGEAVAFSLCNLLVDLSLDLSSKGFRLDPRIPWDVGFSLPNWVEERDDVQRIALKHFHQAVLVALDIFVELEPRYLPNPGKPVSIAVWRDLVSKAITHLKACDLGEWDQENEGISVEGLVQKDVYDFGVLKCSYIVESCAAGLPYLKAMGDPRNGESPRIRKLLVVDVGAGSTDIGYMLRTVGRDDQWVMNYFTPGNTHGLAGDDLTERIWRRLQLQGRVLGFDQAEVEKERGVGRDWPVTQDWIQAIARHAADYIRSVEDTVRLPQEPPLEIILTGGSGPSIDGLADEIQRQVVEALRERGIGSIAGRTQVASVVLPEYGLPDAIAYARRIVSLGAADPEKPRLSHIERLERSEPGRIHIITWRGSG